MIKKFYPILYNTKRTTSAAASYTPTDLGAQVWQQSATEALTTITGQKMNDRQKIQTILNDLLEQRARHGLKEREVAHRFMSMHDCVESAKVTIRDYKVTLTYTLKNDRRGIVYTMPLTLGTDLKKSIKCGCLID